MIHTHLSRTSPSPDKANPPFRLNFHRPLPCNSFQSTANVFVLCNMDPQTFEAGLLLCQPRLAPEFFLAITHGGEDVIRYCGGKVERWCSYHCFAVPLTMPTPAASHPKFRC